MLHLPPTIPLLLNHFCGLKRNIVAIKKPESPVSFRSTTDLIIAFFVSVDRSHFSRRSPAGIAEKERSPSSVARASHPPTDRDRTTE